MSLKIFHTSDLHIGMKFMHYPDDLRDSLIEARFKCLETMVKQANDHGCQLFVVAGDLFEKQNISKRDIIRVKSILTGFAGGTVCLLPGNHDYINDSTDLWHTFEQDLPDNILILKEEKPYYLREKDHDITLYPAPCHAKHSVDNNLAWMSDITTSPDNGYRIGIAHGALEGISPDLSGQYYSMSLNELNFLPIHLWLLGHTHLPYPADEQTTATKCFNAGTPEPDGMDCRHRGTAWLIKVSDEQVIEARQLNTGIYRFIDNAETLTDEASLQRVSEKYLTQEAGSVLLRLTLDGYVSDEIFESRHNVYRHMEEKLAYLKVLDQSLRVKFSTERIRSQFTEGSLPAVLLQELVASHGEDTAHLAYELIREVKTDAD